MNNTNEKKNKLKEEISYHVFLLLNDDWFKDLYFDASDEIWELEDSIKASICKYVPDLNDGLSDLFDFAQVQNIISHNIYRAIVEKINKLYNDKDMYLKNGKWFFSKKSYTIKSISKKIVESVFHLSRNDKKENIMSLPIFNDEYHSRDDDGKYTMSFS